MPTESGNTTGESLSDNSGMRSFLQRGEARLSTMHRIAGVFLNGSGLLVLAPILIKGNYNEIINDTISIIKSDKCNILEFSAVIQLIPFLISIVLVIISLYQLFKDLTKFYFTGHIPGACAKPPKFIPIFSLTALNIASDECTEKTMDQIIKRKFTEGLFNFALPFKEELFSKDKRELMAKFAPPSGMSDENIERIFISNSPRMPGDEDPEYTKHKEDIAFYRLAMNLSGSYIKTVADEVAKMEVSLVRHNLCLRILVLRYFKTILLLLVSFIMIGFSTSWFELKLKFGIECKYYFFGSATINALWSWFFYLSVKRPIEWIYEISSQHGSDDHNDMHIIRFQEIVKIFMIIGLISSVALFILQFFPC